jgi:hypothetical protein
VRETPYEHFPAKARMTMWTGYFDESGIDEKSKTFCIGGFIAQDSDWLDLIRVWLRALNNAGATAFHMTDFEARRGEFRDWDRKKRFDVFDELVSIVLSYDVYGLGGGTVRDDYQKLIVDSDFITVRKLKPEWWKQPYLMVFQQVIVEAANAIDHFRSQERIAFVFDHQAQFKARAETVYAELQEQADWPRHRRLGSLQFVIKNEAVALQVADLMVYEIRKRLDHKLFAPERDIRKSMGRLQSRLFNPHYFDHAGLRAFIASFEKTT